jgi:predicted transcriptional regulator
METVEQVTDVAKSPEPYIKGIPIEKILDLKDKRLSHQQIADLLGCDKSNITNRLKKYRPTLDKIAGHKKHRADILTNIQAKLLDSVTDDKIKECTVPQLTVAYGILYDKERLERGQSSSNLSVAGLVESHSANLDTVSEQIAKLTAELSS